MVSNLPQWETSKYFFWPELLQSDFIFIHSCFLLLYWIFLEINDSGSNSHFWNLESSSVSSFNICKSTSVPSWTFLLISRFLLGHMISKALKACLFHFLCPYFHSKFNALLMRRFSSVSFHRLRPKWKFISMLFKGKWYYQLRTYFQTQSPIFSSSFQMWKWV